LWRGEEEGKAEEKVDGGGPDWNGDGPIEELREVVRNRSTWRMLTMTVARIQRIDCTR